MTAIAGCPVVRKVRKSQDFRAKSGKNGKVRIMMENCLKKSGFQSFFDLVRKKSGF